MFNFMLIEKYNNIWQTDKPKVNSFTGYHSWNIKTWLFTSYAKLRERDTQISSHLSSSAYVVMYTEYIHYPHRFYTNQIKIKVSDSLLFQVLYIKFNTVCTTPTSTTGIYIYLWMRGDGADCACCTSLLKEECQTYI